MSSILSNTLQRFAPKGFRGLLWFSFAVGAGMELFMATVKVNGISFYDVAKRKKAERVVDAEEQREMLKSAVFAQQQQAADVATTGSSWQQSKPS